MDKNKDPFNLDPTPDGPDEEANRAELEKKLKEYHQAISEEFEVGVKYGEGTLTPVEIRDRTKELLTQGVPMAVARMVHLINHGQTESIQFNASKFVIERAMGKDGGQIADPLEALMAELGTK